SGQFNGLSNEVAWERIADWFEERGVGRRRVNYRMRDWLVSRQRYWGTPIPIVYCPNDGVVPVPEDQLPVLLPEDVAFDVSAEAEGKEPWQCGQSRRARHALGRGCSARLAGLPGTVGSGRPGERECAGCYP